MNLLAAQKCPKANGTLFSRIAALRLDNGDANPFGQQPIYVESVVELSFTQYSHIWPSHHSRRYDSSLLNLFPANYAHLEIQPTITSKCVRSPQFRVSAAANDSR